MRCQPMRCAELITRNRSDRVALRGVRVRSRLAGFSQKTVVEQTYVNLEPRAIEAVYTFPLPENAAVCGFEVVTGDHVLTGVIDESDKAIEKYEDAVSSGDAGFLLEQERPDVFTTRVGNIKPKQAATIRITYVAPLETVDRSIRITFPTALAPRYATASGADALDAAIDADALNPPHVLSVPYGLTLEVDIALGRKLAGVTSPTHHVEAREIDEGVTRVSLAGGTSDMDREVVLSIELTKEQDPRVELTSGQPTTNESFLAVTFVPEFDESDLVDRAPQATETVFVLDCSGSMQGQSIAQATAALSLCLRSLSPGDTFNVCRFGSKFEMLSSEPLVYSQHTLDRALAYVNQSADLGGTELLPPLEVILRATQASGRVRQVILLTDGQVTNEPAVVALARRYRAHNRIFTFGIGPASSQFLVKGLARATGGASEFIAYDERIEEKVLRTFARLNSPMIEDVQLDWHGAEVQTLAEIPPVFDGDALTVFGRAWGTPPKSITLRCKLGGASREWSLPVGYAHDDGGVIATMWARRTIQSIEEVNDIRRGAGLPAGAEFSRERAVLVQLSRQFNLLCSLTSFIAVEHRSEAERNEGKPALRRVPVMLAKGWGGEELALYRMQASAMPSAPAATLLRQAVSIDKTCDQTLDRSLDVQQSKPRAARGFFGSLLGTRSKQELPAVPSAATTGSRLTYDVIHAISADGWAQWSEQLEDLVRLTLPSWTNFRAVPADAVRDVGIAAEDPRHRPVVDTVVALLILRLVCQADEQLWRRSYDKAVRWLASTLGKDKKDVESWLAAQQALIPAALVARTGSAR